ncbi:MAG: glycosyltransferase [Methylacidiphilales bacterium]|nr:glycosyltransferase [Candidatus Methylacidiphilales bacterium]
MTHFGIICPDATGHLNPMIALGYELQKRGHRVTLFGILDVQSKALVAGLGFYPIGECEFPIGTTAQLMKRRGELSGLAALKYNFSLAKQDVEVCLRDTPGGIKSSGVEALLIDQVCVGGGTVAELVDIPFVSVCSALLFNREDSVPPIFTSWQYDSTWLARFRNKAGYALSSFLVTPIQELIIKYRQKWNLPLSFDSNNYYSKLAQLSQQPPEFEFPRQHLPSCFHFTGPYSNPASRGSVTFPFEKLTGQPLIYASMGTIQNRLISIFQNIAEACVGLDAQLVISLGTGISPESFLEMPGSPLVVGYAPQLELLKKATLTITHAGLNTTLESLSNGVPMVAIPIATDQPGVAARIAWTGTGEMIPLKSLNVPKLQEAIKRVLTQESYKQNAVRLQEAIRRAGGINRAVDIIEQVVSTGNLY